MPASKLLFVGLLLSLPAAAQTPAPSYGDQGFIIPERHLVVRVSPDGTGTIDLAARYVVQSQAGVNALGELSFQYDSSNQSLRIDSLEVLKPGAPPVLAGASAVQDLTGPLGRELPEYSDLRQKVVTVPALEAGDTIAYHITWTIERPLAPRQFWYAGEFLHQLILLSETDEVVVPESMYVNVKTRGDPAPVTTDSAGWKVYRWRRSNLQLDTTEATARKREGFELTTFRSWNDLASWFAGLEQPREAVTPLIQARAQELVRNSRTRDDSIAALFRFVSQNIRYVSLQFGVGRFQPHAATDVLSNEYGDCKDKHVLLAALLHAIGIRSAPVLVNSAREPDSTAVSPAEFDHLITVVPPASPARGGDTLWLDATPDVAPFRFLAYELRGRLGLILRPDGTARFAPAPQDLPFQASEDITMRGAVTGGDVDLTVRFQERGDAEVLMREALRNLPRTSWPALAARFADGLPGGGTSSDLDALRPEDTDSALWISFKLVQPGAIGWQGGRGSFRLPLPPVSFASPDDSTADTVRIDLLPRQTRLLTLALPKGVTARLPIPVTVTRDYAEYRSSYSLRGDTVEVTRALQLKNRIVPVGRKDDWRAFRHAVENDEDQVIGLNGTPAGGPVGTAPASSADAAELIRRGESSLQAGDARTALTYFREASAAQPPSPVAWNEIGRAYLDLRMLDSAAAAFRAQIALNPYDQYAYNNLGLAQWRAGDLGGAVQSFRKEIEINPLDRYAHGNLGRVDLLLKADSDAARELAKAASITPEDATVHEDLGRALVRTHQPDSAVAAFDRAVELDPRPAALTVAATTLSDAGERLDRAETYARGAVAAAVQAVRADSEALGPQDFTPLELGFAWNTLGWILFQEGKRAEAERYEHSAWLLLHRGDIGDRLGQIYQGEGKRADAVRTYALALNAYGTPPETRGRLTALVGGTRANAYEDSARTWSYAERTIELNTGGPEGTAKLRILERSDGKVTRVEVIEGPPSFAHLQGAIARVHLPFTFPDTATMTLPLQGVVSCSMDRCTLTMTQIQVATTQVRVERRP